MDVVFLSRLQFAVAAAFHFLFVPLTLGLSILVALMETVYVRTGDETYKRMARFWGRLFIINFAVGVVTGLTLEFQFGTNWRYYSEYVGDIFGSLLAIEATLAFFLESTFLAVWIFGWNRVPKKVHLLSIWLVAFASNLSAYWILAANAWMQNPVGYVVRNGRAELENFFEVITNETAVYAFIHTLGGAFTLAGFFVMGISAWHILRKNEVDFFRKSFRMAAVFALVFAASVVVLGHFSGHDVAKIQPAKLAAMEGLWETGEAVPQTIFLLPDEKNERNYFEFMRVPYGLSLLAYADPKAEVKGLLDFPVEDRPPVLLTFLSFRAMVGLGFLFVALTAYAWMIRKAPERYPRFLRLMIWCIPLPYIALELGWMVAEVGRQPWIVYGVMRTEDAASPLALSQVLISLIAFIIVYSLLGLVDFYLLARFARRGPEPAVSEGLPPGGSQAPAESTQSESKEA